MCASLKTIVAEDDELVLRTVRRFLENLGHEIIAEVTSGEVLVEAVIQRRPNLVVSDIRLAGMDGLTAIEHFSKQHSAAVIVISGCDDQSTLERASARPVQAYLPKPITESNLAAAIAISSKRFAELQVLLDEVQNARRRLADRAIVERAKGMLMKRADVDETTAYQKLRSMARNSGQTIGLVAKSLLLAEEALSGLDATSDDASKSTI